MKTAKIGLLGFGNVGGGTYKILTDNKDIIEKRVGVSPEVVKILQRNRKKKRFAEADPALLTEDPDDIIKDPDIDIVVEMLGGIEPATSFMVQSMRYSQRSRSKVSLRSKCRRRNTCSDCNHRCFAKQ